MRTGTQIELTIRRGKAIFYVTIKRGIDNQKRLTLQGEIEDIIADCRVQPEKDVTIVALIGHLSTDEAEVMPYIQALEAHLAKRSGTLGERFEFHVIRIPFVRASPSVAAAEASGPPTV